MVRTRCQACRRRGCKGACESALESVPRTSSILLLFAACCMDIRVADKMLLHMRVLLVVVIAISAQCSLQLSNYEVRCLQRVARLPASN